MRIAPDTGTLASAENPEAILETFMVNHLPSNDATTGEGPAANPNQPPSSESLF
jgi:hypothetical protein